MTTLGELTYETFAQELGSQFRVEHGESAPLVLELVEATVAKQTSVGSRRTPFSLIFRGPQQPVLPQKMYPLAHERLGTLEIFLVPLGPDGVNMRYEAVFT